MNSKDTEESLRAEFEREFIKDFPGNSIHRQFSGAYIDGVANNSWNYFKEAAIPRDEKIKQQAQEIERLKEYERMYKDLCE